MAFREPPALAPGRGPRVGSKAPAGCSLLKRWPPGFKGVPREAPARALDPVPRAPPPVVGAPPAGRWGGWEVVYTDGSKAEGPRAGAGVYWPDAEHSVLPPAALPFGGVYAGDPSDDPPAWGAYVFDGVQNALRAELVALRQAVSGSRDAAPMVAFTDCQSAIYMVARYWRLPHTMTHHHEHDLVKGVVDAVLARTYPVHLWG